MKITSLELVPASKYLFIKLHTDAAVIIGLKTLRLKKCWKFGAFWAFSHKICE